MKELLLSKELEDKIEIEKEELIRHKVYKSNTNLYWYAEGKKKAYEQILENVITLELIIEEKDREIFRLNKRSVEINYERNTMCFVK